MLQFLPKKTRTGGQRCLNCFGLELAHATRAGAVKDIVAAFKSYIQQEARKYEKEFPSELYDQRYRLYNIEEFERGRPWEFKHLTVKHIHFPLSKSNGRILELLRATKATGEDRKKKLFQLLNEVGARTPYADWSSLRACLQSPHAPR